MHPTKGIVCYPSCPFQRIFLGLLWHPLHLYWTLAVCYFWSFAVLQSQPTIFVFFKMDDWALAGWDTVTIQPKCAIFHIKVHRILFSLLHLISESYWNDFVRSYCWICLTTKSQKLGFNLVHQKFWQLWVLVTNSYLNTDTGSIHLSVTTIGESMDNNNTFSKIIFHSITN